MSFVDIVIVFVKGNYYRIHFLYMSKHEAINVLRKCWFNWKKVQRYETGKFISTYKIWVKKL